MLSYEQILLLHEAALREHGGNPGILSENALLSAINQPYQTYGGVDLYEGPIAQAAALGYFLTKAHGFGDGNKRVGYMAMKVALFESGYHLSCTPDEGEFIILAVAEGEADLKELTTWVEKHITATEINALAEISDAVRVLRPLMDRQADMAEEYLERVKDFSIRGDAVSNGPDLAKRSGYKAVFRSLSDDTRKLSSALLSILPDMKASVAKIEANAPHISSSIDFSQSKSRSDAVDILLIFADALDDSSRLIDSMNELRDTFVDFSGQLYLIQESFLELSEVLDFFSALFNQNWFSYREIVDELKNALNEEHH